MLTGLIVLLILAGIVLALVPMDPTIKSVAVKIVVIAAVLVFALWILQLLGIGVPGVQLP
jgi:hypothetical protein